MNRNLAREPLSAARARNHGQLGLHQSQFGVGRGHAQIRGQRVLQTTANGRAVDGRDHGPREVGDRVSDGPQFGHERRDLLLVHGGALLEVGACAEDAGNDRAQNEHAHLFIFGQLVEGLVERARHLAAQGVGPVRPVQR